MRQFATVWVLACTAFIFTYSLANPHAEWDMLAYAAAAGNLNGTPPAEIHHTVYTELENRLTEQEFARIVSGSEYRKVMYEQAEAFNEQTPYYRKRIFFNTLLAALQKLGVNPYDAGHWISATAFTLCFLIVWLGFRSKIHPLVQMTLPVVFYKYTRELEVVQQILTDSLAAMWVAAMCILYIDKSKLLLPTIALAVLIRSDLIIFSALMTILLLVTKQRYNTWSIIISGAFAASGYFILMKWADGYSWQALYFFAIISDMSATHPSVYSEYTFTVSEYLATLTNPPGWISKLFLVTLTCGLGSLIIWKTNKVEIYYQRVCQVTIVCLLYIAVHYLIFPQLYLRFFVAQNMIVFCGFMMLLGYCMNSKQTTIANPLP